MVTAAAENLLKQILELEKHEKHFLQLQLELLQTIWEGAKYTKSVPNRILAEKGIRYQSELLKKRVNYEQREGKAYRQARAAFLITLRKLGASDIAKYFFDKWRGIETALPEMEMFICKNPEWIQLESKNKKLVETTARYMLGMQKQIVEGLKRLGENIIENKPLRS